MNLHNNSLLDIYIMDNKYPKEIFKEMEGTNQKYYISNYGRVISIAERAPHFLDPWIDSKGYEEITIYPKGNKQNLYVHLLVAQYFLKRPETDEKIVVHHINLDKRDNYYTNLCYMSIGEHNKLHHSKKEEITNGKE